MNIDWNKTSETVIASIIVAFLLAIPTYVGYTYSKINSLQREVAEIKETIDSVIEKKAIVKAAEYRYQDTK